MGKVNPYSPLLEEEEISSSSSTPATITSTTSTSKTNENAQKEQKSISIVVEPGGVPIPPISLDPASPPPIPAPIQAVQIKAMKSRTVEQIQEMLQKRRKKNKKNWKQNTTFVVVVLASLAGVMFTTIGVLMHVKYSTRLLWSIPAYLWLYLAAIYIFSVILTRPLARLLVRVWRFSFFYENYIYYYTHGTERGLHILLAAGFPWIYWTYFASQSVGESGKADFERNTAWVPRIYLSFIVVGTSMIGKQILVRILAGSIQAINYREHVRAVLFLEKVLSYLTGKTIGESLLTVTHADLLTSIKNVQKGAPALPTVDQKKDKHPIYKKMMSQLYLKGVGIKTPKLARSTYKHKTPEALALAAENVARKIFAKLDKSNVGYLTVDNFKQSIHVDAELAQSTFDIFDRNGDGYVSQQELASVIEEVYLHRRSLQHSLKDTKNLEKSLEEVVTTIFALIGFMGLLTVFGVDVQASIMSFSVIFFSLGFALGPFLQALIFSIVLIFFVKPYDVGDRISVGSDKEILIVESIGLWMTDTLDGSGKRHYLHNGDMAKQHLINHSRSSKVDISLELGLSLDVSKEVLATMKEALVEWSKTDPELLQPPNVQISGVNMEKNMVTVNISCGLNCSWFDPRRGKAKQEFVDLVFTLIRQLGITYTPPPQYIKLHQPLDTAFENKKDQ